MLWKLMGSLLILCTGALAAWNLNLYEKRRIRALEGWLDLIFYIRTRIDCFLTPIGEIFATADKALLLSCMGNGREQSPAELLRHSRLYLGQDAARLLESFVGEIGCCYREEQVKRCDYYISALQSLRQKRAEALPARLRTKTALCICSALATVILLW